MYDHKVWRDAVVFRGVNNLSAALSLLSAPSEKALRTLPANHVQCTAHPACIKAYETPKSFFSGVVQCGVTVEAEAGPCRGPQHRQVRGLGLGRD